MKADRVQTEMDPRMFHKQKNMALNQVDLSRKGSVDYEIVDLVSLICNEPDMFTTSSCSGRVVLIEENDWKSVDSGVKKRGCRWLYVSHTAPSLHDISSPLVLPSAGSEGNPRHVTLKFEPFVLHVQCRTLRLAKSLCDAGLAAGFRNSGVVVGRRGRLIVAIRSTHSLQAPVLVDSCPLPNNFVRDLVQRVGCLFAENSRRIRRFTDHVTEHVARPQAAPSTAHFNNTAAACLPCETPLTASSQPAELAAATQPSSSLAAASETPDE